MRLSRVLLTVAVALVPLTALAQNSDVTTSPNRVAIGARGTSIDGDGARYERYRDLSDGLFMDDLKLSSIGEQWRTVFLGRNVGREDQRFSFSANQPGRTKIFAQWDQIPMLLSSTTQTLYLDDGIASAFNLDSALQTQYRNASGDLRVALFDANARTFDTMSKRYIGEISLEHIANPDWTLNGLFRHTNRSGSIPYGGSFGHSSLVELPAPVEYTITDFDGSAEFARDPLLFRAGVSGSWFDNEVTELVFDSPFNDVARERSPNAGLLSLPVGSSYLTVNGLLSFKLPNRTRFTAYGAVGKLNDNSASITPQTVNPAISPGPLERNLINGEARTGAATLSLTSRPNRSVNVDVRYRLYEYINQTPRFHTAERVEYDDRVRIDPLTTGPTSLRRHTFTADLNLTPASRQSIGIGFIGHLEDRTFRIFERTSEYGTRIWYDTVGNQVVTLRTKYEYSQRRTDTSLAHTEEVLHGVHEQPGLRHWDVAERDRNRVTVLATLMPTDAFVVHVSLAAGKDDYSASEFGLRDNTHRVVTTAFDVMPTDTVSYGASYSYEYYDALSRSRQAGNSVAQFEDPARNWATDGTDRVHSFILNVAAVQLGDRVDVHFSYDFNRARATYEYTAGAVEDRTLPEEVVIETVLPPPSQLPPTLSELQRVTTDFVIGLTDRVSLGLSHWFENYEVEDFTLDEDANQELARGNVLLLGYLYRPYTANTFFGKLIFHW